MKKKIKDFFGSSPVIIGILIAFAILPFANNISDPFVSDDWNFLYVVSQEDVSVFQLLFTNTQGEFGPGTYRPMVNAFWSIMYNIFGLDPRPYHFVSLGFHVLNVVLVFLFAKILLSLSIKHHQTVIAALAGLFFAIFPNHSAGVAWISVINDTMMTTWYLLAILSLVWASLHWKYRHLFLSISLVSTMFALFTKEMAVTIPFVSMGIMSYIWLVKKDRRYDVAKVFYTFVPMILLTGVYMALRFQVTGFFGEDYANASISFSISDFTEAVVGASIGHFFSDTLRAQLVTLAYQYLFVPVFLVLLIAISFLVRDIKDRRVSVGWPIWLAYVGSLLPVAHFGIGHSLVYISEEGERFSYLPSVFMAIGVALFIHYIFVEARYYKRTYAVGVLVGVFVLISFLTMQLVEKNHRWSEAAVLSHNLLDGAARAIQEQEYDGVVFVGLPDNYAGAFIFRNAFDLALDTKYGIDKKNILVTVNRSLYAANATFESKQINSRSYEYIVTGNAYIADLPSREFLDYTSTLEQNVLDPQSRSHGSVGRRLSITFSEAFMETNEDKNLGLFFFEKDTWREYEF